MPSQGTGGQRAWKPTQKPKMKKKSPYSKITLKIVKGKQFYNMSNTTAAYITPLLHSLLFPEESFVNITN